MALLATPAAQLDAASGLALLAAAALVLRRAPARRDLALLLGGLGLATVLAALPSSDEPLRPALLALARLAALGAGAAAVVFALRFPRAARSAELPGFHAAAAVVVINFAATTVLVADRLGGDALAWLNLLGNGGLAVGLLFAALAWPVRYLAAEEATIEDRRVLPWVAAALLLVPCVLFGRAWLQAARVARDPVASATLGFDVLTLGLVAVLWLRGTALPLRADRRVARDLGLLALAALAAGLLAGRFPDAPALALARVATAGIVAWAVLRAGAFDMPPAAAGR